MENERPLPREVSRRAFAAATRLLRPIERFIQVETASGLVLLVSAALALAVANSPLAPAYHQWLETPLGIAVGTRVIAPPLHFWVNDVLMTCFFFVVGLEIRRETQGGELANVKRAALPLTAAIGGMVVPALVYVAFNASSKVALRGWGVPMATDIAFAVGILALLGNRVPPALRVLLLALAIIDDVGSILVIAFFYSSGLEIDGLLLAGAGVVTTVAFQRFGIRRAVAYLLPGAMVWFGVLRAGIHPTIAGVAMGLLTPARAWEGRETVAPAARLQTTLHPWVAFYIMPLFAFANAGVTIGESGPVSPTTLSLGIVAGLVLGKPAGILLASFVAVRTGIATVPRGVDIRELVVLGVVGGIGFTMSIFVASLAFSEPARLDEAKLAILAASTLAGASGLAIGRLLLPRAFAPDAALSEHEAERSDTL